MLTKVEVLMIMQKRALQVKMRTNEVKGSMIERQKETKEMATKTTITTIDNLDKLQLTITDSMIMEWWNQIRGM
jgi:hypothetical protein